MMARFSIVLLILCFLFPVLWAADFQSFSGIWQLNTARSKWGDVPRPISVYIHIEHNEPDISYIGSVIYASEDIREFAFHGAFDGKQYPMTRSFGNGVITLRHTSPRSFHSVFRSEDSVFVETATTTVSRDGQRLTRKIKVESPKGKQSWTEVYDRRQVAGET